MQGKINRGRHTDYPVGRHSIRTNQCPPPSSPIFFTGCPSCRPTNSIKALNASQPWQTQLETEETETRRTRSWRAGHRLSRRRQGFLRRRHDRSLWRSTGRYRGRDGAEWLTRTRIHRIIVMQVVIGIKKLLEPLDKLKVVLKSAFRQLLYRNDLCNETRNCNLKTSHVSTHVSK